MTTTIDPSEDPMSVAKSVFPNPTNEQYISAAADEYHRNGEVEVEDYAFDDTEVVSRSDGGAYVRAWVWVPDESAFLKGTRNRPLGGGAENSTESDDSVVARLEATQERGQT